MYQSPASKYLIIEKKHPTEYADSSNRFSSNYESTYIANNSDMQRPSPGDEEEVEARGLIVETSQVGQLKGMA